MTELVGMAEREIITTPVVEGKWLHRLGEPVVTKGNGRNMVWYAGERIVYLWTLIC